MISVKHELIKHDISPKRRLGQNFLIDKSILNKIVEIADLEKEDVVVEIGAGWGNLSSSLAKKAKQVYAVEIDRGIFSILEEKLAGFKNIITINKDALKFDFQSISLGCGKKIKVVANLPYRISTPIIFNLLDCRECIDSMILMVQKEVGRRITARPGTKDYGVLAVLVQIYCDTSIEIAVPGTAFHPRPKVESAVVKFKMLDRPRISVQDEKYFKKVVKAAFSKRRKTLSNALKGSSFLDLLPNDISSALSFLGIDGKRRGETLSLDEFGRLSNGLQQIKPG